MKIPWAVPYITDDELNEVSDSFRKNWLSMGKKVKKFEDILANYVGRKYTIAVSNGTVALDLALKVMGIGEDDEVIIPALTYVATGAAVLYQGAIPVFADIDRETFTISPEDIKKKITRRTKAVITMDYGGNACDYDRIEEICKQRNIKLIVDGAQSLGGEYRGKRLCSIGDIAITSFHSAKIFTTIEGGMIFTDEGKVADKLRIIRNQGENPTTKYLHIVIGYNARMTDIQAGIGLVQMRKKKEILERRRWIADYYLKHLSSNNDVTFITVPPYNLNSWFFFPILVENRDDLVKHLTEKGIETRICYPLPMYKQPVFEAFYREECPNAEFVSRHIVNLPMFYTIKEEELNYIVENILSEIAKQKLT